MSQQQSSSNKYPISAPDAAQVRVQLAHILSSRGFRDAPRLQEFLRYVVEEALQGRAGYIKGFNIAHEVFQRDDPADTQTSAIVRVEAGRLRRRLEEYYVKEGNQDPIHIHIPKGAYVPSFERIQADDKEVAQPPAAPKPRQVSAWRKHFPGVTAVTGVIALVAVLLWIFLSPGDDPAVRLSSSLEPAANPVSSRPAIAVLPFEDLTDEFNESGLAMGLTEDIITDLAQLSGVDVIALSSVLPYKDKTSNPRQIGEDLQVSHVLRGSIRGDAAKVRVTAQLYSMKNGNQVWAQRFDRAPDDILALQDELAVKVITGMAVSFQAGERERLGKRHAGNSEAHALYKQAMSLANPPSDPSRIKVALQAFERVIELDPKFAGGYAGAAYMHSFIAFWRHGESLDEHVDKAIEFSRRAIKLDPAFGLAFSAQAFAHLSRRNFDSALAASAKAIKAQPSDPYVNVYHGFLLCADGQAVSGIDYAKRALRLDPLDVRTPYLNILGLIYFQAERYQEALDVLLRNIERGGPHGPGIRIYRAATYASLGRQDQARQTLDSVKIIDSVFPSWRAWILRSFRYEGDAERLLRPLRELGLE